MKNYFLAVVGALMFASPAMAHKVHKHHNHSWLQSHKHYHCHSKKGYCHSHKHTHGGKGLGHHGRTFMHDGWWEDKPNFWEPHYHPTQPSFTFEYHTH